MLCNTPTLHKVFLSIAVLSLVGYAFFNSRFLLQGPEIVLANVNTAKNIIRTDNKDFSLQGTVKHSSYITVNNRPIMVDEAGNFNEKLLLSSEVSIIDIYARDKFGKETRQKIDVVYAGELGSGSNSTITNSIGLSSLSTTSGELGSGSNSTTTPINTAIEPDPIAPIATTTPEIEPDPISIP